MDALPSKAGLCRDELPQSAFYSTVDELLDNEDVDFVDIATPPGTHAELIYKALGCGKHVLCEKPLVLAAEDLENVARLQKNMQKAVFTVHNWRYAPIFQKVSELVVGGGLGEVRNITYEVIRARPSVTVGEESVSANWRLNPDISGGGILVDHGWHAFYMVTQWAGKAPCWVKCRLENHKYQGIAVEDTATIKIGYPDATANLFFTWAGGDRRNRVTIEGTRGTVSVDDDVVVHSTGRGAQRCPFPEALSHGSHHPEWYGLILDDFVIEMQGAWVLGRNLAEATCCFHILDACKKAHLSESRQLLPAILLQEPSP